MSDSQVSTGVLEQPSQGQVGRANEPQDLGASNGQPSDNGQVAKQKDNVAEIQRIKDLEIKTLRQSFEATQRQQQQMIQNLQQQMREAQKASAPDDYSKLEVELNWLKQERDQYATAYQQAVQEKQEQQARENALREVADEFGVSPKDLEEATDYKSAVKLAVKAQQKSEQRKQQHDNERRENNRPDVGGGAPSTSNSKWQDEYDEARRRKDGPAMQRLLRTKGKT